MCVCMCACVCLCVCLCVKWRSPLAASTQQQQHRDQQQGGEGAEGDGQDQLPAAQPRRHPGSSCRPRPDDARLRPPPHSTQHRSHDASHCGRRGHLTGTGWGSTRKNKHGHVTNLSFQFHKQKLNYLAPLIFLLDHFFFVERH